MFLTKFLNWYEGPNTSKWVDQFTVCGSYFSSFTIILIVKVKIEMHDRSSNTSTFLIIIKVYIVRNKCNWNLCTQMLSRRIMIYTKGFLKISKYYDKNSSSFIVTINQIYFLSQIFFICVPSLPLFIPHSLHPSLSLSIVYRPMCIFFSYIIALNVHYWHIIDSIVHTSEINDLIWKGSLWICQLISISS